MLYGGDFIFVIFAAGSLSGFGGEVEFEHHLFLWRRVKVHVEYL